MSGYRVVLLATDFSTHGEAAARRARDIAAGAGARLHLAYVVEHFPEDTPCDVVAPEDVDPETFIRKTYEEKLAAFAERLGLRDAIRHLVLDTGSAKREIVALAERLGADLIVLGSHGGRGAAAWLGSTADGVMHRAGCDVLIVRAFR
jgi:universal stress protein A